MTEPKADVRVVVSKNGPYIVTGNVPLSTQTIVADAAGASESWKQSAVLPQADKYALYRCGQSKKKPFCDGTHTRVGFDGSETATRAPYLGQAKEIDGPVLLLTDVENLCAFGRFCDPNGNVWTQVSNTDDPRFARTSSGKWGNALRAGWLRGIGAQESP